MSNHYDPMIHNRTLPVSSEDSVIRRHNMTSDQHYAKRRQKQMLVVGRTIEERPLDPRKFKQYQPHDTTVENRQTYHSAARNEAFTMLPNIRTRPIDTRRVYTTNGK